MKRASVIKPMETECRGYAKPIGFHVGGRFIKARRLAVQRVYRLCSKDRHGHLNSAIDEVLPWAYAAAEPLKAVA